MRYVNGGQWLWRGEKRRYKKVNDSNKSANSKIICHLSRIIFDALKGQIAMGRKTNVWSEKKWFKAEEKVEDGGVKNRNMKTEHKTLKSGRWGETGKRRGGGGIFLSIFLP